MFTPRTWLDLPRTQALASKSFQIPPPDGSVSLLGVYDWHAHHSSSHPLFEYLDDNNTKQVISWLKAFQAIERAKEIVQERIFNTTDFFANEIRVRPVVAILASSDGNDLIPYYTLQVGIMRAGYAVFPINPHCSAAAVANLLSASSAVHIFVGHEKRYLDLAKSSLELIQLEKKLAKNPSISTIPMFRELYLSESNFDSKQLPVVRLDSTSDDEIILLLHSSGTTGLPKPIGYSSRLITQRILTPYYGERDVTGLRIGVQCCPIYNALGAMVTMYPASCGIILTTLTPGDPALKLRPEVILDNAILTNTDFFICLPRFLEAWAIDPTLLKKISKIEAIMTGGKCLRKAIGDKLTAMGINIIGDYGSTETSRLTSFYSKKIYPDWEYFSFSPHVDYYLKPVSAGIYENIILSSEKFQPAVVNTEVNGVHAYATSDLLERHPSHSDRFRLVGRINDQITSKNGKKTNPAILESILNLDIQISESMLFGEGREQIGLLVAPTTAYRFDVTDKVALEVFKNTIWSSVQKMNLSAPMHSRVSKEAIIVSLPTKPFAYTPKGSINRQQILSDYADKINDLYEQIELDNHLHQSNSISAASNALKSVFSGTDTNMTHGKWQIVTFSYLFSEALSFFMAKISIIVNVLHTIASVTKRNKALQ